jgi:hypothetical protein
MPQYTMELLMGDVVPNEPHLKPKRGRPRKNRWEGQPTLDPSTFAHIKAMQAGGSNSRAVANALQLDLVLVNHAFSSRHYLEFSTGRLAL